jgi:hypothetical protein
MRYYLFVLSTMLLIVLQTSNTFAVTSLKGVVTARRGDSLKVEFQINQQAAPQPGDLVDFFQMLDGYAAEAGMGTVTKIEDGSVWVQTDDPRPTLAMNVSIYATGSSVVQEKREHLVDTITEVDTAREVVESNVVEHNDVESNVDEDNGWSDVSYQKINLADRYVKEIVNANKSCNYQQALQIADQARNEIPDNAWINQNYPTMQILARRGNNYQKALNNAYLALEKGEVTQSITYMRVAMQNASVQCGQDKQILSLLDQAKLISRMAREEAIEKARQKSVQNAHDSQRYKAEIEKKRADRKAFGQALSGNLLGILKAVNSSGSSSNYLNNLPSSNNSEDMFNKMARDTETNNKDILNKWRKSQGWSTLPASNTSGNSNSGNNSSFQNSQQSSDDDQMRQMVEKMNENETLKKWHESQSQGWPARPPAKKSTDSGWQ